MCNRCILDKCDKQMDRQTELHQHFHTCIKALDGKNKPGMIEEGKPLAEHPRSCQPRLHLDIPSTHSLSSPSARLRLWPLPQLQMPRPLLSSTSQRSTLQLQRQRPAVTGSWQHLKCKGVS